MTRVLLLVGIGSVLCVPSQSADGSASCSLEKLEADTAMLRGEKWKYHPGDNPAWADPDFDDTSWPEVNTEHLDESLPGGWKGIGWFRLHVEVDSTLWDVPLGMVFAQTGASELYLNGRLVYSRGTVSRSHEDEVLYLQSPDHSETFVFGPRRHQVIAIRYSNASYNQYNWDGLPSGFLVQIEDFETSNKRHQLHTRLGLGHRMFFTGWAVALCLLYFFMYLYYPRLKAHLYFAFLALSIAGISLAPGQMYVTHNVPVFMAFGVLMKISVTATCLFALWFLYTLFYERTPRQLWAFLVVGALLAAASFLLPRSVVYFYALAALAEASRVVLVAVVRKKDGSRIIGIGYLLFIVACAYQMLQDLHVVGFIVEGYYWIYLHGILALMISMSIYLARHFFRIHTDLSKQLVQVKGLSAKTIEQERQAKEQEVAKKLLQQEIEHREKELEKARKLEEALADLHESDERYRSVFENATVGIFRTSPEGRVLTANPALAEIMGYKSPQEIVESITDLAQQVYQDPQERQKVLQLMRDKGQADIEICMKRKDEAQIMAKLTIWIVKDDKGNMRFLEGFLEDVTEKKKTEEKLKLYHRVFMSTSDGITITDPEGSLIECNPSVVEQMGKTVKQLQGIHCDTCAIEDDAARIRQSVAENRRFRGEVKYRGKDGKLAFIDLSVFPIYNDDGELICYVGIGRDVTDRKLAEDALREANANLQRANEELKAAETQLVQSEKMASLGMLVAGVAHEINTPVGAINSMHDTLIRAVDRLRFAIENECSDTCVARQALRKHQGVIDEANKVIQSGSERVTNIVKRLRSFARLDEAELKTTNINECLEDTLTLIHHEIKHNIEVIREYGDIPQISCYPGQLNQVFLNLLINAKQAIDGKGRIEVATVTDDSNVVIKISDNGHGIPKVQLAKVFDPGFTTKGVGVGTGLGLSICYQIIQAHRGEINVMSTVGKGTTFTITLPMDLDKTLADS
jgi:PAS domain S-box-containing protein